MRSRIGMGLGVACTLAMGGAALAGGSADEFTIGLEEMVSNGVPGKGAGNIESGGATDVYTIAIDSGTLIYADEMGGGCGLDWEMRAPDDSLVFFDTAMCSVDPGLILADQTGDYTITVMGQNENVTGTYAFTIWAVNPDDEFDIGLKQVVSNGVPGAGAGNIEEPGSRDVYTLTLDEPVSVYVDEISGGCNIAWTMIGPGDVELFADGAMCSTDPKEFDLAAGEYTIIVTGTNGATGTYSFVIWAINEPEMFTLGLEEQVSVGVPGPGAGNIEEPGAMDIYTLTIDAPTSAYFDEIDGGCSIRWRLIAPDQTEVFFDQAMCSTDPKIHELDQVGDYTIIVEGFQSTTGSYSFTVWDVNPPDEFSLDLEQSVSDGVPGPGAGNIEEPGTIDVYTLTIDAPTTAYFDEQEGGCAIDWFLTAPDKTEVFFDTAMCSIDPKIIELDQVGDYTITVDGAQSATGTYAFTVWELNPTDEFALELDAVIEDGIPGPGAGNIEEPGTMDRYTFEGVAGEFICILEMGGSCAFEWTFESPTGVLLWDDLALCVSDSGTFELPETGTYTITVDGVQSATGTYGMSVLQSSFADLAPADGDCRVNTIDLLELLGVWGECAKGEDCPADFNMDGVVDTLDLLTLLGEWTG